MKMMYLRIQSTLKCIKVLANPLTHSSQLLHEQDRARLRKEQIAKSEERQRSLRIVGHRHGG